MTATKTGLVTTKMKMMKTPSIILFKLKVLSMIPTTVMMRLLMGSLSTMTSIHLLDLKKELQE